MPTSPIRALIQVFTLVISKWYRINHCPIGRTLAAVPSRCSLRSTQVSHDTNAQSPMNGQSVPYPMG